MGAGTGVAQYILDRSWLNKHYTHDRELLLFKFEDFKNKRLCYCRGKTNSQSR